ncbi:hypothetical protein BJV82DRAFT_667678 [Fennellomyces sp. T-0311]|nr:hypothetical protein BJV82DRAFT_667678 [Fennellomyces sp. T-0311]
MRDLQLAIEDFHKEPSCSETCSDFEKTPQGPIDNTYAGDKTLCEPSDEKTQVEEEEEEETDEKTLVEPALLETIPIRFSDDFSTIVHQFKVDPSSASSEPAVHKEVIDEEPLKEESMKESNEKCDKYLVEDFSPPPPPPPPLIITTDMSPPPPPPPSSSSPLLATPKSRSSMSSRRSRRTLSKKSSKSSRYFPKQLKPEQPQDVKYHARSYDEMMRIPDTRERLAFYDRTFKLCMKADSKLSSWVKRVREKGLPKPMTEGYKPPPRPASPEIQPTPSMSSSLSGSISTFLKKASASNTMPRRTPFGETPKPSLSRLFFAASMSRLSLSRSPRPKVMPFSEDMESSPQSPLKTKPTRQKPPRISVDSTGRWRGSIRISPPSSSADSKNSPRSITSSVSSRLSRTLRKSSCDHGRNDRPTIPEFLPPVVPRAQGPDAALNELCNVLPQLDRQVVQEYLSEAGGDPMVAITLAMSQYKKVASKAPPSPMYNHRRQRVK